MAHRWRFAIAACVGAASGDPEWLLSLGVTCDPANHAYRAAARRLLFPRPFVIARFVVGLDAFAASPALVSENRTHGDVVGVPCPEGRGFRLQSVLACKTFEWYAHAIQTYAPAEWKSCPFVLILLCTSRYAPALWYAKLEDDHFVALGGLAYLRGADVPRDAAAATWIFHGDESRRRRGRDVKIGSEHPFG